MGSFRNFRICVIRNLWMSFPAAPIHEVTNHSFNDTRKWLRFVTLNLGLGTLNRPSAWVRLVKTPTGFRHDKEIHAEIRKAVSHDGPARNLRPEIFKSA